VCAKVVGSIDKVSDKMTGKLGTDLQKSTDKITAAVRDGVKDVSDAVRRARAAYFAFLFPSRIDVILRWAWLGMARQTV